MRKTKISQLSDGEEDEAVAAAAYGAASDTAIG